MAYRVLLHPKVASSLKKMDERTKKRIKEKLKTLEKRPESGERFFTGWFWKLRVGDYRVIYEINKKERQVIILFIGHRSKVYDDFKRLL